MPSPKATAHMLMPTGRARDISAIDVSPFFAMKKSNHEEPASEEMAECHRKAAEAFATYRDLVTAPDRVTIWGTHTQIDSRSIITQTERNRAYVALSDAAVKMRWALNRGRLTNKRFTSLDASYNVIDANGKIILYKELGFKDGDFHQMRADLRHSNVIPLPQKSLDLLTKLSRLRMKSEIKSARYANPALILLIQMLAPIWKTCTGYSVRKTGNPDTSGLKYYFADSIIKTCQKNGIEPCPHKDQINHICLKINDKVTTK